MNHCPDKGLGPRLVTSAPESAEDKFSRQIAEGVQKFHALWAEFDAEMFRPHPDYTELGRLILEINTLRNRLLAHGVQIQP